jgi:predicted lipid-binding transport protein (Tim44 family)
MKKILAALIVGISLVAISLDASAARLGGGSSIGRSMSMPKAPAPAVKSPMQSQAPKAGPATAAGGAAAASKGMGLGKSLLIGAASALGIMALANMLGLGEGFGQMMMVVLLLALAYFALRMFFGRKAAAPASSAPNYSSNSYQPEQQTQQNTCQSSSAAAAYQPAAAGSVRAGSAMDEFSDAPQAAPVQDSQFEVPAEFDKENFLNMSTAYFKMLQKAWDSGDMDGLNNYCTQEMFIALTHKRREIKGINLTEVMQLEATLAGFETLPTEYVASVKFRGTLKENGNPVDIEEIWNLVKPKEGKTGWMLAGIQQVA